MASISACAPLRAYRPLSGRLRSVTSACQRQLSDGTGTRRTPSLSPKHTYSIPIIPQPHVGLVAQRSHGSHIQSSLRSFSTSRVACSRAVVNPRKDDDGNDMLVDITPRASNVGAHECFHSQAALTVSPETACDRTTRLKSLALPPSDGRVGRMSWLSIPHVAHIDGQDLARGRHSV